MGNSVATDSSGAALWAMQQMDGLSVGFTPSLERGRSLAGSRRLEGRA